MAKIKKDFSQLHEKSFLFLYLCGVVILEKHIVPKDIKGVRLSDYCGGIFTVIPSRKGMKKAISRGEVYVNGQLANTAYFLQPNDEIQLIDNNKKPPKVFELSIPVVYEDDYFAVLNKPSGLATSGNQFRTLQNALPHNIKRSELADYLKIPRPVHRLDAATSGLIIAAKIAQAHILLSKLFEEKNIQKTYAAVVIGKTSEEKLINTDIDKKEAITNYKTDVVVPSLRNKHLSLLSVQPLTGRTHQIRKHLSESGHPIFGDKLYGQEGEIYKGKGLFLAAVKLEFEHPFTHTNLCIEIPIPNKFLSLLKREERRYLAKNKG